MKLIAIKDFWDKQLKKDVSKDAYITTTATRGAELIAAGVAVEVTRRDGGDEADDDVT